MDKLKYFLLKIFRLDLLPSLFVILTAFPLLWVTGLAVPEAVKIVLYVYSAYGLTVLIFFLIGYAPRFGRFVKGKIAALPFFGKYLSDAHFVEEFSVYQGLAINAAFAVYKIVSSVLYGSVWLASIGIYYIILSAVRLVLTAGIRRRKAGGNLVRELKCSRLCGVLMLALNVTMVGVIIQMVRDGKSYDYPGVMIYVTALFAFYSLISAAVKFVRTRRMKSPLATASKMLSLAGALMSMTALTTAMLSRFGGGDDGSYRRLMTSCVGTGASLLTVGMSLYIVIRCTCALRKNAANVRKRPPQIGNLKIFFSPQTPLPPLRQAAPCTL